MADEVPKGRARGRARGRASQEEITKRLEATRLTETSSIVSSAAASSVYQPSGVYGTTREQAAGDSSEGIGRSRTRSRVGVVPAARVGIPTSSTCVSTSSGSDSGGTAVKSDDNGKTRKSGSEEEQGSGSGEEVSQVSGVGRGAKRGKPVQTGGVIKTIPANLATKVGTGGTAVKVLANYFALKKRPEWRLYQYRVDMLPEVDYTKERKYHLKQNQDLKGYFFDGTVLIATRPLCAKDDKITFNSKRSSDDQIIQVTVRHVGEVEPTDSSYIQFLNIIVRCLLEKLNLDLIGRNYFDSKAKIDVKAHNLQLYPGYVTSIRQHEKDVLLGVEISHKILRTDTVYDMIKSAVTQKGVSKETLKDKLEKMLLGQIVITKYNNKTYKISEVRLDMNPQTEFEDKKGNKIKFCDYYLQRWGFKIHDLNQPLIVSIPKETDMRGMPRPPIQLVPELCNMTGLSDAQRANFNLMRDLSAYTRQEPTKKVQALQKFSDRISGTEEIKDLLLTWDMKFDTKLQEVEARQLPPEVILGAGNSTATYDIKNADWGTTFRKCKCLSVVKLQKWCIIFPTADKPHAETLMKELKSIFGGLGMDVGPPKMVEIADCRMGSYMAALNEWTAKKPELIMTLIPNNKNADLYSMIKKKCCVESPTPTQVVTASMVAKGKGLKSIATKIGLQMNCKIGGQLWSVKVPLAKTMVVGFDTYHDSQQKGKSVGALVASINASFTKYFSTTEFHDSAGAQEISGKIALMMVNAVNCYTKLNGGPPERIFFYRDGVGEGQIRFVYDVEVTGIKQALLQLNPNIKLTFIITSKRINARFMCPPDRQGKCGNPCSGTVIDDVVTLPERYDFFLVSQSVNQGTVNPTSYNVICDDNGLPPGRLQTLTYKLTHLYFNWSGTVRVPAPVQYAHKLAYLVGTSIHQEPSPQMEELLYFL